MASSHARERLRNALQAMANSSDGRDLSPGEMDLIEESMEAYDQSEPMQQRKTAPNQTSAPPWNASAEKPQVSQRVANRFPGIKASDTRWKSFGEFAATVGRRQSDPRFYDSMSEGVGPDGGYSVPVIYGGELITDAIEKSDFAKLADLITMSSNVVKAWGFASTDHSSQSLYGGYTATWRSEGETMTSQDPDLREITLKAKKLGLYTVASNEVISDGGSAFEMGLRNAMTSAAAWHLDHALLRGTGAGTPLGVLNAPGTIEVAAEAAQSADTIVWSNILKMWARLAPQSQASSKTTWVAHPSTIPQIMSMFAEGTSSSIPTWLPANGQSPLTTLLGKPIIFSEKASVLGDKGDLFLIDWSQVALGIRLDMALSVSGHEKFSSDQTAFRLILRCDAQPKVATPLTPSYGSDTLGPYVVLAERAG